MWLNVNQSVWNDIWILSGYITSKITSVNVCMFLAFLTLSCWMIDRCVGKREGSDTMLQKIPPFFLQQLYGCNSMSDVIRCSTFIQYLFLVFCDLANNAASLKSHNINERDCHSFMVDFSHWVCRWYRFTTLQFSKFGDKDGSRYSWSEHVFENECETLTVINKW